MQIKNIDMPFKGYIKSQKLISYVLREEYLSKHFKISKKGYIIVFPLFLIDLIFYENLKLNITKLKLFTKNIIINQKKFFYLLNKYKKNFESINFIIKNNQISFKNIAIKSF